MESKSSQNQPEEEEELFEIKKIQITPETSLISQEVSLKIQFQVKKAFKGIKWKLRYILDSTGKRHIIDLYESKQEENYEEAGKVYSLQMDTPKIQVENVPRKTLLNVGLLHLQAVQGEEVQLNINMVVHVSKDKSDQTILNKTVLNPLE